MWQSMALVALFMFLWLVGGRMVYSEYALFGAYYEIERWLV